MNSNRTNFLNNIRDCLQYSLLPEASSEHPGAFQHDYDHLDNEKLVEQFRQELEAVAGQVHVLEDIEDTATKIIEITSSHQANRIIAWNDAALGLPGLHYALSEAGISVLDHQLPANTVGRKAELAEVDDVRVGLTGADGGLADNGAVALSSGPGRGRLASLLPPVHIALLPRYKIYASLAHFISANPNVIKLGSNLVFIAGPSRSGDIELSLSMGVHGPGEVHVIITP